MIDRSQASTEIAQPEQESSSFASNGSYSLPIETQNAKRILPELIPLLEDPDAVNP